MHQVILGDLNTMGHGVARLSPHYCCDVMRWRTLGWYEAAWWHAHVLSQVWAVAKADGSRDNSIRRTHEGSAPVEGSISEAWP